MLDQAISFAAIAHAGQKRKYTFEPYIVHPIEVMTIVHSVTDREDMHVAAVLHDVLEDTIVRSREIERRFGLSVRLLVEELTEVPVEGNREARVLSERQRLAGVSAEAQTIKVADLISNSRSIMAHDPRFAQTYLREKRELLEVLKEADAHLVWEAADMLAREGF